MNREDFIYADEATILVTPNDVCLIHQIVAPRLVTPQTLQDDIAISGDTSLVVGSYVGKKEDVMKVYMTHSHAIKLKDALTAALSDSSSNS